MLKYLEEEKPRPVCSAERGLGGETHERHQLHIARHRLHYRRPVEVLRLRNTGQHEEPPCEVAGGVPESVECMEEQ